MGFVIECEVARRLLPETQLHSIRERQNWVNDPFEANYQVSLLVSWAH